MKRRILVFTLLILLLPMAYAIESKEVYDINDRQTKELQNYFDDKFEAVADEASQLMDTMFQTFDQRMQDLTKNFVIQMAVIFFFTTLLANALIILARNKFEKDLAMYKYNVLLEKESEIRRTQEELARYNQEVRDEIVKRKMMVGGMNAKPLPDLKESDLEEAPKPKQKKGLFKRFKKPRQKKEKKSKHNDFLKGVK